MTVVQRGSYPTPDHEMPAPIDDPTACGGLER